MPNSYFQFKEFLINQELSGMKVTTDGCLFGAWVASELKRDGKQPRILDIGTGTGLLALMIAQVSTGYIDAVEINQSAFEEASNNFKQSKWGDSLKCWHSAIQDFEEDVYDFIVSNPPFFNLNQLGSKQDKNQAIHTISLSENELLENVRRLLKPNGEFFLLYPEREMRSFIEKSEKMGVYPRELVQVRNQGNQHVFRIMARFGQTEARPIQSELIIRDAEGKYTSEFWLLLQDYYLEYNNPRSLKT